jgi:hypothetical protein
MTAHSGWDQRIRRCPVHKLRPRCPGCELERKSDGTFPTLEVPKGAAEWLRNAARFYEAMGPMTPTEFAAAISVDLRETA